MKTTERGWPAHFCCVSSCIFRRNTLVDSEVDQGGMVVVSTVGDMRRNNKTETITIDGAYYETKAFVAEFRKGYWEADISHEITLESKHYLHECEYMSDLEANIMHDKAVLEIQQRIKAGERFGYVQVPSDR